MDEINLSINESLIVFEEKPEKPKKPNKLHNTTRVKMCPNCDNNVSTNGFNFISHIVKCNEKMAKDMYPKLYQDFKKSKILSIVKKLNRENKNIDKGFFGHIEIKDKLFNGYNIVITNNEGKELSGVIFNTNIDFMFGS